MCDQGHKFILFCEIRIIGIALEELVSRVPREEEVAKAVEQTDSLALKTYRETHPLALNL
jgi:hypothetical protein